MQESNHKRVTLLTNGGLHFKQGSIWRSDRSGKLCGSILGHSLRMSHPNGGSPVVSEFYLKPRLGYFNRQTLNLTGGFVI